MADRRYPHRLGTRRPVHASAFLRERLRLHHARRRRSLAVGPRSARCAGRQSRGSRPRIHAGSADQQAPVDARLHDASWLTPFDINTRMAPKLQVGRVFIGGDACHVHSPLGGQGMNTGMQDVYNLTWKLAHVIKGHAPQSLLDSYATERHANAERLLKLLRTITKGATLHEPLAIWLRNILMNAANRVGAGAMMARRLSQLDTHYRDSPVVAEHSPTLHGWLHATVSGAEHAGIADAAQFKHGPQPGDRAPDVLNLHDAAGRDLRLFQGWLGDTGYQCLIFTGSHPKSERLADLQALCERIEGAAPGLIHATIVRHPAVGALSDCTTPPALAIAAMAPAMNACIWCGQTATSHSGPSRSSGRR
ncbi:MAG: hypothetical protein FJY37_06465 [Betaproteobacteria bacterium]|nr:hypothetical protein [Betaproteobacteria bacterium]